MADTYIGDLPDGGLVQTGDAIPAERAEENFRVVVGSAAAKAASDATKGNLASVNGATVPGHLAIFADEAGTIGDGGALGGIIADAPLLTPPVLTTDLIPIVRGGQIYLATVDDMLAAQPPAGAGGQFDFSDAQNSAYAA